jgi:hypothetical protein
VASASDITNGTIDAAHLVRFRRDAKEVCVRSDKGILALIGHDSQVRREIRVSAAYVSITRGSDKLAYSRLPGSAIWLASFVAAIAMHNPRLRTIAGALVSHGVQSSPSNAIASEDAIFNNESELRTGSQVIQSSDSSSI